MLITMKNNVDHRGVRFIPNFECSPWFPCKNWECRFLTHPNKKKSPFGTYITISRIIPASDGAEPQSRQNSRPSWDSPTPSHTQASTPPHPLVPGVGWGGKFASERGGGGDPIPTRGRVLCEPDTKERNQCFLTVCGGDRNRVGIQLSYRPARGGGIDYLESILGHHKC